MLFEGLLTLDGVPEAAMFRDDGLVIDALGLSVMEGLEKLARFARDYKRFTRGNADQLSMFTQLLS